MITGFLRKKIESSPYYKQFFNEGLLHRIVVVNVLKFHGSYFSEHLPSSHLLVQNQFLRLGVVVIDAFFHATESGETLFRLGSRSIAVLGLSRLAILTASGN